MAEPVLRSDKGITLIGGGPVSPEDLAEALAFAPDLVAADGGADRALALGAVPKVVIGDFDSLSDAARTVLPPERLCHVAEQDSTDFEKCLTRIAAPFVLALGVLDGRHDHGLSAMNAIARIRAPRCILLGAEDLVFLAPPELALDLPEGARFSLFPLGAARGTSRGLRWPIDGLEFSPDGRIGTSNEVAGPVSLAVEGPMLVILPRGLLPRVVAQLA